MANELVVYYRTPGLGFRLQFAVANIHQLHLPILADHQGERERRLCLCHPCGPNLQSTDQGHSPSCCFAKNRPPGARGRRPTGHIPAPLPRPRLASRQRARLASTNLRWWIDRPGRGPTHASTRSRFPIAVRPPPAGRFCPGPSRGEPRLPSSSSNPKDSDLQGGGDERAVTHSQSHTAWLLLVVDCGLDHAVDASGPFAHPPTDCCLSVLPSVPRTAGRPARQW